MSEFWTLMVVIAIGTMVLIAGIIFARDPGRSVEDALADGLRWGSWFLLMFSGQALAISSL